MQKSIRLNLSETENIATLTFCHKSKLTNKGVSAHIDFQKNPCFMPYMSRSHDNTNSSIIILCINSKANLCLFY